MARVIALQTSPIHTLPTRLPAILEDSSLEEHEFELQGAGSSTQANSGDSEDQDAGDRAASGGGVILAGANMTALSQFPNSSTNTPPATVMNPCHLHASLAAEHFTPPSYPNINDPNPFATLTPEEIHGFMPAPLTLAMNAVEGTCTRSGEEQPLEHTAIFELANRPLRPGENIFETLDPLTDWRRLHNIIGGWVPVDGSPHPMAKVVNKEMEPEADGVGEVSGKRKTHGGRRSEKTKGWQRRGGAGRQGRGNAGAFENMEAFIGKELVSRGFDPRADIFTPGYKAPGGGTGLGGKWRRDEHNEGGV